MQPANRLPGPDEAWRRSYLTGGLPSLPGSGMERILPTPQLLLDMWVGRDTGALTRNSKNIQICVSSSFQRFRISNASPQALQQPTEEKALH